MGRWICPVSITLVGKGESMSAKLKAASLAFILFAVVGFAQIVLKSPSPQAAAPRSLQIELPEPSGSSIESPEPTLVVGDTEFPDEEYEYIDEQEEAREESYLIPDQGLGVVDASVSVQPGELIKGKAVQK